MKNDADLIAAIAEALQARARISIARHLLPDTTHADEHDDSRPAMGGERNSTNKSLGHSLPGSQKPEATTKDNFEKHDTRTTSGYVQGTEELTFTRSDRLEKGLLPHSSIVGTEDIAYGSVDAATDGPFLQGSSSVPSGVAMGSDAQPVGGAAIQAPQTPSWPQWLLNSL